MYIMHPEKCAWGHCLPSAHSGSIYYTRSIHLRICLWLQAWVSYVQTVKNKASMTLSNMSLSSPICPRAWVWTLQNYKKVIEYSQVYSKKLKIIAKILATFRNNVYLAASVIDMSLCTFRSKNVCSGYPGRIPRGVRLYRYCPIL